MGGSINAHFSLLVSLDENGLVVNLKAFLRDRDHLSRLSAGRSPTGVEYGAFFYK